MDVRGLVPPGTICVPAQQVADEAPKSEEHAGGRPHSRELGLPEELQDLTHVRVRLDAAEVQPPNVVEGDVAKEGVSEERKLAKLLRLDTHVL